MSDAALPIQLPSNRQTLYPAEVMELLSMDDKTLRAHEADGTLIAINVGRAGCRPVRRYTVASIQDFVSNRNSRDNPDHVTLSKLSKPRQQTAPARKRTP